MAGGDSVRAVWAALMASLATALAKGIAAVASGSSVLLVETLHSLAGSLNQGLLALALGRAREADARLRPLGHGKALYFWSFLVAVMVFTLAGMMALDEGIHRLHDAQPVRRGSWALGAIAIAFAAEAMALRACLREVQRARSGRTLARWFRESRQGGLVVVFGQRLASLLGLSLALAAVALSVATGDATWDALGTIAVGVLMIVVAVLVAVEVKAMLVGQSIDPVREREMRAFLEGHPDVVGVVSLLSLQVGNEAMVAVQVRMREGFDAPTLAARIDAVERALEARFPEVRWSFLEPDLGTPAA